MNLQMIAATLLAASSFALPAVAAPLEIGIGTHFGHNSGNLTIARGFYGTVTEPSTAGLVSVRDDISWGQSEIVKDQITLRDGGPKLKNLLTVIPTISRPMLILNHTNQYYDGGGRITSDEGRAAFSRFAATILPNFPTAAYVEIGNEWNLTSVGAAMAADYTKLVKATIPVIKALDAPKPKVIVGALADDYPDWAFARQLIAGGALDGADGLSVHLYNHCMGTPTKITAEEMAARLDALHLHMGDAYANTPIYVTEFGWPVAPGSNGCAVAEDVGGLNTLRFLLEASVRPWIGGVWIYEMMNNGTPETENTRYNSFGLVRQTSEIAITGNALSTFVSISDASVAAATKPMGCVMKDPLTKLIGLRPQTISNDGNLRSAVFNDNGTQAIVIWNATTYPATVPGGSIKVYGANAGSLVARSVCGGVSGGVITSVSNSGADGTLNFNLDGGRPLVIEVAAGAVVTSVDLHD